MGLQAAQYIPQPLRKSVVLRTQRTLDLRPFLLFGEPVVAGNHLIQPVGILATDMPQVAGQLIGQRVAVANGRFKPVVVQLPVLPDDIREGDAVIRRGEKTLPNPLSVREGRR